MSSRLKRKIKAVAQTLCKIVIGVALLHPLPLSARKWVVVRLGRRNFIGQSFLSFELLRDFATGDPMGFHQFLWAHHVGGQAYGKTYEIARRFGDENLRTSRRELFEFLRAHLMERGIAPERDVQSVLDVGCSLGYVLHFLGTQVLPAATCLRGVDVDRYAIEAGKAYLRRLGSKIELVAGDIASLDSVLGEWKYDVVVCCGVLMYLDEGAAAGALKAMLAHTKGLLAVISLADPQEDNAQLARSYARAEDLGFIHNVDEMIRKAGGYVVFRKWTGPEEARRYTRNPPLFTLAHPGP